MFKWANLLFAFSLSVGAAHGQDAAVHRDKVVVVGVWNENGSQDHDNY